MAASRWGSPFCSRSMATTPTRWLKWAASTSASHSAVGRVGAANRATSMPLSITWMDARGIFSCRTSCSRASADTATMPPNWRAAQRSSSMRWARSGQRGRVWSVWTTRSGWRCVSRASSASSKGPVLCVCSTSICRSRSRRRSRAKPVWAASLPPAPPSRCTGMPAARASAARLPSRARQAISGVNSVRSQCRQRSTTSRSSPPKFSELVTCRMRRGRGGRVLGVVISRVMQGLPAVAVPDRPAAGRWRRQSAGCSGGNRLAWPGRGHEYTPARARPSGPARCWAPGAGAGAAR